jgi:hypothetical protein
MPECYKEVPKLGRWGHWQRAVLKTGKMDPGRKRRLDEIGFDFNPEGKTKEDRWDFQFERLRAFEESHGHCELFWAINRLIFILNTPTNTPLISLPELQAMCQGPTALTLNWPYGPRRSGNASELVELFLNGRRSSTRLVSISIPSAC